MDIAADSQIFDRVSALAARTLKVPLGLVSLVNRDRQVFKGMDGVLPEPWQAMRCTPLSHSFCQYVQASGEPLVVPDARLHPVLRDNLAVAELNVIAYMGVPLTTAAGHVLGSFCVIDHQPRQWTPEELEILRGLAALALLEIESHLSRSQLQSSLVALQSSENRRSERTRLLVHDLRTPLNSLLLGLKTLPMLGELNEDQQEAFDLAVRGGQTLVELVDDLLDTDAAQAEGVASLRIKAKVDAALLMAEAVAQVTATAAHQAVTLAVEAAVSTAGTAAPLIVSLDVDVGKMVRALVNLLSNAVKFTDVGGQVSVSAREDGENVIFSVRDTGRGIEDGDLERIFERFVHLDAGKKGAQRSSGLGLAFVKATVEAHGGSMEVESTLGKGSVFSMVLPRRQSED